MVFFMAFLHGSTKDLSNTDKNNELKHLKHTGYIYIYILYHKYPYDIVYII